MDYAYTRGCGMKSFIPKPYTKEGVTVRIDVDKLAKMDSLAAAYGLSRSCLLYTSRCV